MKKLLLILAIGAFVACNDSGTEDGSTADTTVTTGTDTTMVMPAPDTTTRTTDTLVVRPDTTATK